MKCLRQLWHWMRFQDGIRRRRYICSVDPGRVWEGFHVTESRRVNEPWNRFLSAPFVPEDWWVKMFGLSDLVDKLSDRLTVWTIPMSGWMNIRYRYICQRCTHRPTVKYVRSDVCIWKRSGRPIPISGCINIRYRYIFQRCMHRPNVKCIRSNVCICKRNGRPCTGGCPSTNLCNKGPLLSPPPRGRPWDCNYLRIMTNMSRTIKEATKEALIHCQVTRQVAFQPNKP